MAQRILIILLFAAATATAQELPPELTGPVNDFANVIDRQTEASMDGLIRSLQRASGDVVVVATVETVQPYADVREYAVKMFENRGRGIGTRDRDNGVLILLAVKDRQVRIEVGYDLEQFVTDGFAGDTSRRVMIPEFRRGDYSAGMMAGLVEVITRIAQGRNVTLEGVPDDAIDRRGRDEDAGPGIIVLIVIAFLVLNAIAARSRRRRGRHWGGGGWSGWSSGVGAFGAGWGSRGGFGGGGFGGGFGGFGGGGSGGGGGGGSW
jgi:uncharacterized protein